MRVTQISNCNSTNHYRNNAVLADRKVYSASGSICFHGNTKSVFASIGSAIAGLFSYINNIGKYDYDDESYDKFNIPTERYPGEDSIFANGNGHDTAY